jgi:hypothetical protein
MGRTFRPALPVSSPIATRMILTAFRRSRAWRAIVNPLYRHTETLVPASEPRPLRRGCTHLEIVNATAAARLGGLIIGGEIGDDEIGDEASGARRNACQLAEKLGRDFLWGLPAPISSSHAPCFCRVALGLLR